MAVQQDFGKARHPVRVELPDGDAARGILKSLRDARRNVLSVVPKIATQDPIVSGRAGTRWHMVMDPEAIREILLDRVEQYPKSLATKNLLKPAIGDSMFIAEGSHWRWQRRATAPAFTHRNILNLAPIMTDAAERSAGRLSQAGPRAVNMLDEMTNATFDVIADVTFSGGDTFDRESVHRAIEEYSANAGKISLLDILGLPGWIPRPGRMLSAKAMQDTKDVADKAIMARKERGNPGIPDLLDLMLAGEDPKSARRMTPAQLRDNLLTFIVAGHETTALALAWSFYLLAFDPAIQDRARAEVRKVLGTRPATGADVAKLPFTRQIIDEALRLYPPGGLISRTALAKDTLCGTPVMPGDTVMIPIYALHRHEALWQDPDHFRPDRFATRPDRYTYLPFGDGPRICIGMSFAMQESIIILATLLARFRFTAVKGKEPTPVMIITLRPEGGVWLQVEKLADA